MFVLFVMQSYLTEVRGLKLSSDTEPVALVSYLTEVRYLISLVKKL